jgi:hypothetical protein
MKVRLLKKMLRKFTVMYKKDHVLLINNNTFEVHKCTSIRDAVYVMAISMNDKNLIDRIITKPNWKCLKRK